MGNEVGNEVLQQATIALTILVTLGKIGGVKTLLTPFLSRGTGHNPLREVLLLLRTADHNTLQESLRLFRAAITIP